MKYKWFFIILLLLSVCCKKKPLQPLEKLELPKFTLEAPSGFQYIPAAGIDSHIGYISNNNASFKFDYGLWGSTINKSPREFLEINSRQLHEDSFWLFVRIIDTSKFTNASNNKLDRKLIEESISDLELLRTSKMARFSIYEDKKADYYYSFKFQNKQFSIPFFPYETKKRQQTNFEFKIDTIDNHSRTIAIYQGRDTKNYSHSLVMRPKVQDTLYYNQHLLLWINADKKLDNDLVEKILRSVRIKPTTITKPNLKD